MISTSCSSGPCPCSSFTRWGTMIELKIQDSENISTPNRLKSYCMMRLIGYGASWGRRHDAVAVVMFVATASSHTPAHYWSLLLQFTFAPSIHSILDMITSMLGNSQSMPAIISSMLWIVTFIKDHFTACFNTWCTTISGINTYAHLRYLHLKVFSFLKREISIILKIWNKK